MIRDDGAVIYNRISARGYEECQGDILAISGMAEDIRDALLEYQVGSGGYRAATVTEYTSTDDPATGYI